MVAKTFQWQKSLDVRPDHIARIGYFALAVAVITFGSWAAFAPIDSAVVAAGSVAAAGRNIQLQHLEGGIVREIRVREGDKVRKGQVIMVLEATAAQAQLNRLLKRWAALSVRIARLEAERDGRQALRIKLERLFPDDQVEIPNVAAEEVKEFDARVIRYKSELQILSQRLNRLDEAIVGISAQRTAVATQTAIVDEEVSRKRRLVEQGLTNRSEYSDLLRIRADLLGQSGALSAEQTAMRTQVAEAQEQIQRLTKQRIEEATVGLNETRIEIADVLEQLDAARAVVKRTTVRSPVDGIVVSSLYNVVGNVIAPGEHVMEILPTTDEPSIEARLRTTDIDAVSVGQGARVRLVALNARTTPEMRATVQYVSADRIIDRDTQEAYYRILLGTAPASGASSTLSEDLYPGMPVEVMINTGERTFLEYLIKPFQDSMSRAFVEE